MEEEFKVVYSLISNYVIPSKFGKAFKTPDCFHHANYSFLSHFFPLLSSFLSSDACLLPPENLEVLLTSECQDI